MRKLLLNAIAIGIGALAISTGAQAVTVTMSTAKTTGSFNTDFAASFNSKVTGPTASATFDYSGPLSFNVGPPQNKTSAGDLNSAFFDASKISGYAGTGTVASANADFSTLASFLASSASVAGYGYGSLLTFDLGVLGSGTTLKITHDDGVSVYQGSTKIGNTVSGPTTAITESVMLTNTADTVIYYSRQNGAPSVLNLQVAAVPEPETYALMAAGLLSIAFIRRRNKTA